MPPATHSGTQERAQTGVRANGREPECDQKLLRTSGQPIRRANASFADALTQLIPAWVNASNASVPAAYFNPRQAVGFAFDIQQQMLTLQRTFWDELLHVSQKDLRDRTILQDPDALGFYVEND